MAWPDAVSIVRELGVRESSESGPMALLGAANHAAPYPSCCAKTRHYETNRLAHLSPYLFDTSRDARYVHAGGHSREAYCASGRRRAIVPRKNTRNVGSAWTNAVTCTYFVPFCARAKIEHFR